MKETHFAVDKEQPFACGREQLNYDLEPNDWLVDPSPAQTSGIMTSGEFRFLLGKPDEPLTGIGRNEDAGSRRSILGLHLQPA